jgi:hypothetical protein
MVEFVVLAVVLVVPLVYVVLALFEVQRAAFATSAASREAARVFVTAASSAEGESRAAQALGLALADQGLDEDSASLRIECTASPCLVPSARVTVTVDAVVALPFVPWFGDRPLASVSVDSAHTQTVDAFSAPRP